MTTRPVDSRIDQLCDACQQIDKHPRHHNYDPATGTQESLHLDCCAAKGCESCAEVLAAAPKDAQHGDALVAHLTKDM